MHHPANPRSRDLHRFANGIDLLGRLDLTHRRQQRIAILDHDLWMPVLDLFREFALEIKGTFRRKRLKTKPEGCDGPGREKFVKRSAQGVDVFDPFHPTHFVDLFICETPACPDLLFKVRFGHKQAFTEEVAFL